MTDSEIKELWLKLQNVKTFNEAFKLLREIIPNKEMGEWLIKNRRI